MGGPGISQANQLKFKSLINSCLDTPVHEKVVVCPDFISNLGHWVLLHEFFSDCGALELLRKVFDQLSIEYQMPIELLVR